MPQTDLKSRLQSDLTEAIRSRDEVRSATLRMALTAVRAEEVAGTSARTLSDDEVVGVLGKEAKKRREAAEAYRGAGRQELADREGAELVVLEGYLPAQLSDEEIAGIVAEAVAEVRAGGRGRAGGDGPGHEGRAAPHQGPGGRRPRGRRGPPPARELTRRRPRPGDEQIVVPGPRSSHRAALGPCGLFLWCPFPLPLPFPSPPPPRPLLGWMVTVSPSLADDPAPGSVEATKPAGTLLFTEPPTRGCRPACARIAEGLTDGLAGDVGHVRTRRGRAALAAEHAARRAGPVTGVGALHRRLHDPGPDRCRDGRAEHGAVLRAPDLAVVEAPAGVAAAVLVQGRVTDPHRRRPLLGVSDEPGVHRVVRRPRLAGDVAGNPSVDVGGRAVREHALERVGDAARHLRVEGLLVARLAP